MNYELKGKLNKNGSLMIERAGKMSLQYCKNGNDDQCGDWCPLMSEPDCNSLNSSAHLMICEGRVLEFIEFKDERGYE